MHFTVGIAQLGGGTNGCRLSPHHHHLLRPRRLGKIILGLQQIALLRDPWRVATSGADDVQRELVLQFRLSACPLRMEQSRPTQDWPETATDTMSPLLRNRNRKSACAEEGYRTTFLRGIGSWIVFRVTSMEPQTLRPAGPARRPRPFPPAAT